MARAGAQGEREVPASCSQWHWPRHAGRVPGPPGLDRGQEAAEEGSRRPLLHYECIWHGDVVHLNAQRLARSWHVGKRIRRDEDWNSRRVGRRIRLSVP